MEHSSPTCAKTGGSLHTDPQRHELALLLPSKGRLLDLILTLSMTSLSAPVGLEARFIVVANYSTLQLTALRSLFGRKATFIDERTLKGRGMVTAYNSALAAAAERGAEWVALWADDLVPSQKNWLALLMRILERPDFQFGIFSSDEGGHPGRFGWNIFAGYPCAHFYVARIDALPGYVLNPKLKAYVGDNEIAINCIKRRINVDLLPVKVIHQPTINATRLTHAENYKSDLESFYRLHPDLTGRLDAIVLRGELTNVDYKYIVDEGRLYPFNEKVAGFTYDDFKRKAPIFSPTRGIRLAAVVRRAWNSTMMGIVKSFKKNKDS